MPQASFINYNGNILPAGQPLFGPDNRSFRYGDGLFESLRIINGNIMHLPLHAKRLEEGMKALKLKGQLSTELLRTEITTLARSNKYFKDARVRISVFREDGGFYIPEGNNFRYLIEMQDIPGKGYELNKQGLIIGLFEEIRKAPGPLSNFKTNNSLPYVLAGIYRTEQQWDECLLLNTNGNLTEAITSNVFLVKNNVLYTPALSEGCIGGVMRLLILTLAAENGIQAAERPIPPEALLEADEVFITNAAMGIRWVGGYASKRYFGKLSKELTAILNKRSETVTS